MLDPRTHEAQSPDLGYVVTSREAEAEEDWGKWAKNRPPPSHCYAPPELRQAGLMRFESVTIAAGENAATAAKRDLG